MKVHRDCKNQINKMLLTFIHFTGLNNVNVIHQLILVYNNLCILGLIVIDFYLLGILCLQ